MKNRRIRANLAAKPAAIYLQRNLLRGPYTRSIRNYMRLAEHWAAAGNDQAARTCLALADAARARAASNFVIRDTPQADLCTRLINEAYEIGMENEFLFEDIARHRAPPECIELAQRGTRRRFRAFLQRTGYTPAELERLFYSRLGRNYHNHLIIGTALHSHTDV